VVTTARNLLREGGVRRLYRGLIPELAGMTPTRSAMYAGFDLSRQALAAATPLPERAVVACAGGIAGVPEGLVTTPFQVVKVRLQAKENIGRFTGNIDCALQTIRREGLHGIMAGVQTTIWRNSVWNGVYFLCLHELRAQSAGRSQSPSVQALQTMAEAFAAGFLATSVNAPLDTAKSRIQARVPAPTQARSLAATGVSTSESAWAVLRGIIDKEGLAACYKVRASVGLAALLLVLACLSCGSCHKQYPWCVACCPSCPCV
jgi:solute carrier family 25 2-oxodicarboxylate transporter 21